MLTPRGLAFRACLIFSIFFFQDFASAQASQLDGTDAQIAKEIKLARLRNVAVADFASSDSSVPPATGHFFALYLSELLDLRERKNVNVLDHAKLDAVLTKLPTSPAKLTSVQELKDSRIDFGNKRPDILVMGNVVKSGGNYLLDISLVKLIDGSVLDTIRASVRLSEFLESFAVLFPAPQFQPIYKAGANGIGIPRPVFRPDPRYSRIARAGHIEGITVLDVIISKEGRVIQLRPIKVLGYGLDEEAYDAVKQWRFTPATDEAGKPVNVVVPIEISFRLS